MGNDTNLMEMAQDIEHRDKIIVELQSKLDYAKEANQDIERSRRRLLTELRLRPPRVLEGYTLGKPPECGFCGSPMVAQAHDTGDGWATDWWCDSCDTEKEIMTWPFICDWAVGEDWEYLGFEVV